MSLIAAAFAALAALLHVYIFLMESAWWTRPAIWKRFGLASQSEAETTRVLAYNQGFYNLFLAIGTAVGLVMFRAGPREVGAALMFFGMGSMVLAALVLITSGPGRLRSALTQGTLPLIGVVVLLVAV
jgi:putative membrane protein